MIQNFRKYASIAVALAFMLAGTDAFAGASGTIIYAPPAQPVPALSGIMLAVLAMLFAVLAFRTLRAHSAGKPLASLVAAGILALAAASGNQLIQSAQALAYNIVTLTIPSGASIIVLNDSEIRNGTGQTQQIVSITPNGGNTIANSPSGSPQCTAGLQVQNNNSCFVNIVALPPI